MNDTELLWRASMTPRIPDYPFHRVPKTVIRVPSTAGDEMTVILNRPFPSLAAQNRCITKSRPSTPPSISCFNPKHSFKRDYTSVMIVPTGIGAAIGGYAGDALPVARTLSSVIDCLITHPNVGLVLDSGIEEELRVRHLQVADAARASLGLPVVEYVVTDTPLQVEKWIDPKSGQSTGRIKHPDSLLRAVQALLKRSQVNAIAVVGRFSDDDDVQDTDDYRKGLGIDLLAGVEAVISHLVVKEFQIPCAHAPALSPLPLSPSLCPKSAAEELGYTFLPCVLAGLSNAPQYLVKNSESENGCILASDVDSVILPVDAFGGDGVLAFAQSKRNKPLIIAVEENETVLDDTPDKVGVEAVKVSNYWEAIGVIAAHKAGVNPHSLRRNRIKNLRYTSQLPSNGYAIKC
ncbi:unnamed protein product [Prunus armeniaca]|uniref:DUF3326 domain-containing protein n=1 Tax=Prunus armeniaca TaxID=36596 RepID=A0A6J5W2C9_PRUAR|nr:unnamed protein product [Prunus armeniaca]